MDKIFFTSDTHYSHKNLVRGTTNWEDKDQCRDFDTIEEMNDLLVTNINKVVKEDDIIYHLGDWSFGNMNNIWEFRKRINCNNVHLILGNHDTAIKNNCKLVIDEEDVDRYFEIIHSRKPFSYKGQKETLLNGGNIQILCEEIFSSVSSYKEIKVEGKNIVLCHYAMRVWNRSHKGSIMLYGHSHGTLDQLSPYFSDPTWIGENYYIKNHKTMDVGVDTNNLSPYSLEEVLDIMSRKDILFNVRLNE